MGTGASSVGMRKVAAIMCRFCSPCLGNGTGRGASRISAGVCMKKVEEGVQSWGSIAGMVGQKWPPLYGTEQPLYGRELPDLYQRQWAHSHNVVTTAHIPLYIAQFNVLADGLSAQDEKKGGFTESPPESLDFEYRKVPLVAELFRHGVMPDIVAMEEVDHFHDWFEPVMNSLGYVGSFLSKPDSPCKYSLDPSLSDGCALFWRQDSVSMLEIQTMNFDQLTADGQPTGKKANQVAILATLKPNGGAPFLFVVTHLLAKKNEIGERARSQQSAQLLDRVYAIGLPCVLALDMNAAPRRNPASNYTSEAYPAVLQHKIGLRSAYANVLGDEPEYTTWKRRGDHEAKQTIDYILVSPTIEADQVLLPPLEDDMDSARLPGWRYPSDHVALIARLRMPKVNSESERSRL